MRCFRYEHLTQYRFKDLQTILDGILVRSVLGVHGRAVAKPACLSRLTLLFDDICVQANKKMPKGPLYDAAEKGDVEASIAVIHVTGQLQTLPRPST